MQKECIKEDSRLSEDLTEKKRWSKTMAEEEKRSQELILSGVRVVPIVEAA